MSLCNKVKYLNPNIFRTRCCKPLIFQTLIIWFNRIHSLKYLRSVTFGSKDIVTRKSEFVAKTQFLCKSQIKLLIFRWKSNSEQLCAIPCNYAQFRKYLITSLFAIIAQLREIKLRKRNQPLRAIPRNRTPIGNYLIFIDEFSLVLVLKY